MVRGGIDVGLVGWLHLLFAEQPGSGPDDGVGSRTWEKGDADYQAMSGDVLDEWYPLD